VVAGYCGGVEYVREFTLWTGGGRHDIEIIGLLERGNLGVPIFFVLSGFVIAFSLDGKPIGLPLVGRFMLCRSIRLDPPYWSAIIITVVFSILANVVVRDRQTEIFSISQVVAHQSCRRPKTGAHSW
jgi:peptidoglycan/LPS O-acetylase OafA/YrhL